MDEAIVRQVRHHEATLYYGTDGGDSLVTRMARGEDRMTAIEKAVATFVEDRKERERKIDRKQNAILTSVLGIGAAIVLHYIFHIG